VGLNSIAKKKVCYMRMQWHLHNLFTSSIYSIYAKVHFCCLKALSFCQFAVMLSSLWTRFVLEFTVDHLDNQEVHSCAMA